MYNGGPNNMMDIFSERGWLTLLGWVWFPIDISDIAKLIIPQLLTTIYYYRVAPNNCIDIVLERGWLTLLGRVGFSSDISVLN